MQYYKVKEEKNILQNKARIYHILSANCLLQHVVQVKIEETVRRGRRSKQLLDDLKETRGYWKLKEEAQDSTVWRGYGPVTR
jgi:hypothetical protein